MERKPESTETFAQRVKQPLAAVAVFEGGREDWWAGDSSWPEARAVLTDLPREDGNPWVIRGRLPGSHITDLQKPWRRIRAHAGLEDVRIHDLRHSHISDLATHAMIPCVRSLGVDRAFAITISPSSRSKPTRSVNVPPMSTPTEKGLLTGRNPTSRALRNE